MFPLFDGKKLHIMQNAQRPRVADDADDAEENPDLYPWYPRPGLGSIFASLASPRRQKIPTMREKRP